MTTVITGATGMIGLHLFAAMRAAGKPVRVLSRTPPMPVLAGAEVSTLPTPDAPSGAFEAVLAGASEVVHCAALNSDDKGRAEKDFFAVNARLTGSLARAASRIAPGRFVYLSSTRAMSDASETIALDEKTPCRPTSVYGRSKLEGERALKAAYDAAGRREGAVVLRLPLVYGAGMRGQLGALLRLAATPTPLPLKTFGAPRTLASRRSVTQAIALLLAHDGPLEEIYLAGDREAVNAGQILSAFRKGLSRPQRLFDLPEILLRAAAALALQGDAAGVLGAGQIVLSDRLTGLGWTQEPNTMAALTELAALLNRSPGTG
jgi:UDP-glucose 4-epimerase